MKRLIKFRGHAIYDSLGRPVDKIVYGDLIQSEYAIEIWDNGWGCDADSYVVDPESVAQLVGFDANGNEVYEGDTVLRFDDEEEFVECPENGKLCTVIFYTQVIPDLNDYYCLLEDTK